MAISEGIGFLCVGIAIFGFGSNFVPVKRFETGDGIFYQWIMCSAIFVYGLCLQVYLFLNPMEDTFDAGGNYSDAETAELLAAKPDVHSVKLYPLVLLGGALWATGNTMAVPVINMIGLGMGLLVWGCTNMLVGWASGRFGIQGLIEADPPTNPTLNSCGVALVVVALGLYTLIKPEVKEEAVDDAMSISLTAFDTAKPSGPALDPRIQRVLGTVLAMVSGVLYGSNFTPNTYMAQKGYGPEQPLDYVFSHFCGIYAASTFWFIVYCVIQKSSPRLYPRVILPAMLSGLIWAVAQTSWFVANAALSLAVAFPMITSGPGAVGAAWGVFVFGEIRGKRNYIVLGVALTLTISGCVMIGASKS